LRHGNGAGCGDLTIAGPLSSSVICGDNLGIAQTPSAPQDQREAALQTINALAELFPECGANRLRRKERHRAADVKLLDSNTVPL